MANEESPRLRVTAFTGGRDVPSARFRIRQLLPALAAAGVTVCEKVPRISAYPPRSRLLRPLWAAGGLAERLPPVLASRGAGLVVFQRELLSTLFTLEGLAGRPRVLDVDDAVFLMARAGAARRLAEIVDLVVCGNAWLAEHYRRWNDRVEIIPTAVDTGRYVPDANRRTPGRLVIGWSGTGANLHQLERLGDALGKVLRQRPEALVRVVSDRRPRLPGVDPQRLEYVPWSRRTEVAALQGMDIGLMPLEDEPWVRGKCSYKMLLYMACGLPVVVSPVGMNREVLEHGTLGLGAEGVQDWIDALLDLASDPAARARMGANGREVAQQRYSIAVLAPRVADAWRRAAGTET